MGAEHGFRPHLRGVADIDAQMHIVPIMHIMSRYEDSPLSRRSGSLAAALS